MPRPLTALTTLALLILGSVGSAQQPAGDWPWWRGPNHNGIAAEGQQLPVKFSDSENVAWKVTLPGRGHSSPTVVGQRIYLCTADEQAQVQSVLALDRASGKQLWKTQINQGGFPKIHRKNTHATCTLACDGKLLFAAFCHHDQIEAVALSTDGKIAWRQVLGPFAPKQYQYGYAPSPVIYNDLVLFAADSDSGSKLSALQRAGGKRVWITPRPQRISYSSPIVGNVAGRDQLLLSGADMVAAYDPASGKPLWTVPATTMATCGTMIWSDDLVFASGGYPKAETVCIKADGSGKIVWKNNQKCYEQSMLVYQGHVYAVNDNGVAICWKADDGTQKWVERLSGPISSSPILAGGNIYQTNERGKTYVFKPNPEAFELVAENQLGDEGFATSAFCGNAIYLRTATRGGSGRQEFLYCLKQASAE